MVFTKRLRESPPRRDHLQHSDLDLSPHVKVGGRYRMDDGEIEIDSIEPIELSDITPQLARESGFLGVADLMTVAKHGTGQNIYLIRFRYLHTLLDPTPPRKPARKR